MTRSEGHPQCLRIVERYTHEVASRLRGPHAARLEAADEIKDHLLEAIEATGERRVSVEVVETTIAGFGRPEDVAKAFQAGLSRRMDRRTALALLSATAGICALWFGIFVSGPRAPWTETREPKLLAWSDIAGSTAMKTAIIAAFVAVLFSWILPRAVRNIDLVERTGTWARRSCLLGFATLVLGVATILGYALARGLLAPHSLEWSDVIGGVLVSVIALSALGRLGAGTSSDPADR